MSDNIVFLGFLLLLSALFSGAEVAFMSVSDLRVRHFVEKRVAGARSLFRLKEKPSRLLITILIYNNLVNIGASALATFFITKTFGSLGVGIATGVMTFFILVFGEIIPKSFALKHNETLALTFARPLEVLGFITLPLIWFFEILNGLPFLKIPGIKKRTIVTEEELRMMARLGAEEGTILKKEREMLEGVFKFNDITAEDVMTPRVGMLCLDAETTLKEVLQEIIKSPHSRIPIYSQNKDHIIGILYLRDVLVHLAKRRPTDMKLKELSRKPLFILKDENVDELFREFQEKNVHIAIVQDEYGGTEGLVTMKDLVEELVGEIIDEADISKEVIMRLDRHSILVDGSTELKTIRRFFNAHIPGKDHETIGRVVLRHATKIPKTGDKLNIGNVAVLIEEATKRGIGKLKLTKS